MTSKNNKKKKQLQVKEISNPSLILDYDTLTIQDIKERLKTRPKHKHIPKYLKEAMIHKILDIIKSGQGAGLSHQHYSKEFGLGFHAGKLIYEKAIERIPVISLKKLTNGINWYFEKSFRDLNAEYSKTDNLKEKLAIKKEYRETIKDYTTHLENCGLKERLPQLIGFKDFTGVGDNNEINKVPVIVMPEVDIEKEEAKQKHNLENENKTAE